MFWCWWWWWCGNDTTNLAYTSILHNQQNTRPTVIYEVVAYYTYIVLCFLSPWNGLSVLNCCCFLSTSHATEIFHFVRAYRLLLFISVTVLSKFCIHLPSLVSRFFFPYYSYILYEMWILTWMEHVWVQKRKILFLSSCLLL